MPHITVEYPAAIGPSLDVAGLVARLHQAAIATAVFPLGGIRSFAHPAEFAQIGDGAETNGFVRVDIRIAPGRTDETKRAIVAALFAAAQTHLASHFAGQFALQLELFEFNPAMTMSRNTMIPGGSP